MSKNKLFLFCFLYALGIFSQNRLGLIEQRDGSAKGYVLFAPLHSKTTYLIDKCGNQVHTWTSNYRPGQSVYLLPKGELLRTGNDSNKTFKGGGIIERYKWENKLIWSYKISNDQECQHHDVFPLPNGNILVLVWEKKSKEEAIKAGRDQKLLGESIWSEKIIELKPSGKDKAKIVWEWHAWDHLIQDIDSTKLNYGVVRQNRQLIDLNFLASKEADWLHFNSIAYHAERDEIMISNRNFSEIYIIDHSTTTAESSAHKGGKRNHGGDLLYRYGNPQAYKHGSSLDQKLFGQHHAHWIEKGFDDGGKIMLFNNGQGRRSDLYSSIDIIETPLDSNANYADAEDSDYRQIYSERDRDEAGAGFFSPNVSSAQRLANGNTLVCSGSTGRFCELTKSNQLVWLYINPVQIDGIQRSGATVGQNQVFRCTFYEPGYSAFKGKKLKAGNAIELNPLNQKCNLNNTR